MIKWAKSTELKQMVFTFNWDWMENITYYDTPRVKVENIKIEIPLRCGQLIEIEGLDESLHRVDAELAIFSRQNSSADGTEKSQNGLGSVTGRAQRTHAQMIVTLGEFLTVAVHDQWKMGEPGRGDGQT